MRRLSVLLTLCFALAAPAAADAARQQEAQFQDDNMLVYAEPGDAAHTLDLLRTFGVDRVRVSVFWKVVAPGADEDDKPQFDAADPAAYPPGAWDRYDTIVRLAAERGIAVNFNVTSPAPDWATGTPERKDIDETYDPNAREFNLFVRALGIRYSGHYQPVIGQPPLPRVNYWSIWNEPNHPGWLTPQWARDPADPKHDIETSPRIYRDLVDAAYDGLLVSGHEKDTILVGETAPKGVTKTGTTRQIAPLRFVRQVYCLDDNLQFLQGSTAQLRGCPVSDQAGKFVAQHPALFKYTGWAHHPYELTFAPHVVAPNSVDSVTTANLPALQRLLTRVFQRYGQPLPGNAKLGVPLYMTEFGYETDPPAPQAVSPVKQAAYLNEAEYIAWRNPTVKSMTQFLLVDDKPVAGVPRNDPAAWGSTFQTGLVNLDGSHKPSYDAYRMPIFLPVRKVRRGKRLLVWGGVRPVPTGTKASVSIEQRTTKGGAFKRLAGATTDGKRNYVTARVRIRRAGAIRLAWRNPATNAVEYSRAVSVSLKKRR